MMIVDLVLWLFAGMLVTLAVTWAAAVIWLVWAAIHDDFDIEDKRR